MKPIETTPKDRVSAILFTYPEKEFSLSDLAKEAGVSKSNMGNILEEIKELVTIEKLSKIWRIKANQTNKTFAQKKIVFNLNSIYASGVVEYLVDYFNTPKSIILFGSFRRGEDLSNSDIDVAIESEEDEIIDIKKKILGRKVQAHLFSRKDVDSNVFNNIANGILLWGFLEVNKC